MKKVRINFIKSTINNLLQELNINKYPIDITQLCRDLNYFNLKLIPYSSILHKFNNSFIELFEETGSDEGVSYYLKDSNKQLYVICYNDFDNYDITNGHKFIIYYDVIKIKERQRWTLAHELGHVLLNHHKISNRTKISRNGLKKTEYDWMENEADKFAELLLANPLVLSKLNISNYKEVMNLCNISKPASLNRIRDIDYINNSNIDLDIEDQKTLQIFSDFINQKKCKICNFGLINKNAQFCPICANKLIWGESNMKYNEIELDKNNRTKICPICDNEEPDIGDFCSICGHPRINKCINCDEVLVGNARFCTYCSQKSMFFELGMLSSWEDEIELSRNLGSIEDFHPSDDIPF